MENKIIISKEGTDKTTVSSKYPYLVTGEDLLNNPIKQMPCLWQPFFIQQGLIALTGGSDLGKSSFLRQFAISIVLKENNFLNSPLHVRYGRALYLATEDNKMTATLSLQNSIAASVKPEQLKNLCYLLNPDNPLKAIEEQLMISNADVVIIDSFGDVFKGDLNNNISVRDTLNKYQKLSEKYDTLFTFLHHTGKRTENSNPSKNNIIGSQGFEAKMRLVMELRKPDSSNKRILHFTKGNYLSETVKNKSLELIFDNNQQFRFIGQHSSSNISTRTYSNEDKAKIIEIAQPLLIAGNSYDKIREILVKNGNLKKVPVKNTIIKMLSSNNVVQSA